MEDASTGSGQGFGLMFYNARWYDPSLGRFTQADTLIPQSTQGVQAWDHYAYTNNNPLLYTDPTGHRNCEEDGYNCPGDSVGSSSTVGDNWMSDDNFNYVNPYPTFPPVYIVAGINIQSPWAHQRDNNTDQFTNLGPAKISDAVMKTEYGKEVYDGKDPRGTGIGLPGRDQMDPSTANWAMTLRIQVILNECGNRCSSNPTNTFVVAALAQNGWDKLSLKDALLPKYKITPTNENGPTIDWKGYFGSGSGPRWSWDHPHQVDLFVTEVQALQQEGWYVPDVDWKYINSLR